MGLLEYVEKVEHGIKELEGENFKLRDHINRLKNHNEGLISAIHDVGYDIGYDVSRDKYFLKASTHVAKSIERLEKIKKICLEEDENA